MQEDIAGLIQSFLHVVQVRHLDIDICQVGFWGIIGSTGDFESHPHGVDRDINHIILVMKAVSTGTVSGMTFGSGPVFAFLSLEFPSFPLGIGHVLGEHSDHGERLPVDMYDLAHRIDLLIG